MGGGKWGFISEKACTPHPVFFHTLTPYIPNLSRYSFYLNLHGLTSSHHIYFSKTPTLFPTSSYMPSHPHTTSNLLIPPLYLYLILHSLTPSQSIYLTLQALISTHSIYIPHPTYLHAHAKPILL